MPACFASVIFELIALLCRHNEKMQKVYREKEKQGALCRVTKKTLCQKKQGACFYLYYCVDTVKIMKFGFVQNADIIA